jgi:hypothetical protein
LHADWENLVQDPLLPETWPLGFPQPALAQKQRYPAGQSAAELAGTAAGCAEAGTATATATRAGRPTIAIFAKIAFTIFPFSSRAES